MGEGKALMLNETERISREIEATRLRIEYKAEDLKCSLTPASIKRVKASLTGGTENLLGAFRENPVPISLMGAGLGWLIIRDLTHGMRNTVHVYGEETAADRIKDKVSGAVTTAKDAVSDAAHKVGDTVSAGASRVKNVAVRGAHAASDWFTTTLESNPLILAAISLGCGLVAGLAIPASKAETETAGKIGEKIAGAFLEKSKDAIKEGGEEHQPSETTQNSSEMGL
jgi:hypothetical protein